MSLQTFSKIIGGCCVKLNCLAAQANQADFMLELLAKEHAEHDVLRPGYKLQIGWSMYFVTADGEGCVLAAPDYNNDPFTQTTTNLTMALSVQMRQNDVLRRANVAGEPVSFQDSLIVLNDAFTADSIYMLREKSDRPGDSGWYAGLVNDAKAEQRTAADYTALYTWQLLQTKPLLLSLLALPYGCMAIIDKDEIVEIVDGDNRKLCRLV